MSYAFNKVPTVIPCFDTSPIASATSLATAPFLPSKYSTRSGDTSKSTSPLLIFSSNFLSPLRMLRYSCLSQGLQMPYSAHILHHFEGSQARLHASSQSHTMSFHHYFLHTSQRLFLGSYYIFYPLFLYKRSNPEALRRYNFERIDPRS